MVYRIIIIPPKYLENVSILNPTVQDVNPEIRFYINHPSIVHFNHPLAFILTSTFLRSAKKLVYSLRALICAILQDDVDWKETFTYWKTPE